MDCKARQLRADFWSWGIAIKNTRQGRTSAESPRYEEGTCACFSSWRILIISFKYIFEERNAFERLLYKDLLNKRCTESFPLLYWRLLCKGIGKCRHAHAGFLHGSAVEDSLFCVNVGVKNSHGKLCRTSSHAGSVFANAIIKQWCKFGSRTYSALLSPAQIGEFHI